MRVVIGDRFRRWSSSSIAFRRWVMGTLLVTQDSSVRLLPESPRTRCQFFEREASAAAGGFVHPHITLLWPARILPGRPPNISVQTFRASPAAAESSHPS